MKVVYDPDFPKDIRKFEADYKAVSDGLAARFRQEVADALDAIKSAPISFSKQTLPLDFRRVIVSRHAGIESVGSSSSA